MKIFGSISFSGMLSCVTKEEFVDFTIQIIEKSMGKKSFVWDHCNKQTVNYKPQKLTTNAAKMK